MAVFSSTNMAVGALALAIARACLRISTRQPNEELKPTAAPSSLVESFTVCAAAKLRCVRLPNNRLWRDAMFCTLTIDGIPLGQVELTGAPRAIGFLGPL